MEAGKRTISDIFNGNRLLEVPFFQRAYVWEDAQWERLLKDMEQITELNKPYFLGSVILKQLGTNTESTVGDKRTIIDGQQRLTTLCIFFKVLCLKNKTNSTFDRVFRLIDNKIAVEHNHNDRDSFEKIMSLESLDAVVSENTVIKAYNYFVQYLNPQNIDFQKVLSKVMFVVIDLGSEEDEQQIFDTINSLGVRLTTAELLKNYFFGRNEIKSYEDNWKSIFEKDEETKAFWDREIVAGRQRRETIDLFFYSFLQIKLQDNLLKVKAEDKKNLGKVEGLFDSYKTFIREYKISKPELIQEIKNYAIVYKNNIDHDAVENELPSEYGIERINAIIFGLDNSTLIPYVLYVLKNVESEAVRKKIFRYLETYIIRRMICRATNKNYNRLFSEELISDETLSFEGLIEVIEKKSDKVNFMPLDEDLEKAFSESVLTNKQAAGIIYLIESLIRDRSKQSTTLLGMNKYSLEHIMPKKWENNWGRLNEEGKIKRNRKLLSLGNLTIITSALNSSIRDSNWATKKAGRGDKSGLKQYAAGIETFSPFLDIEVWDESAIDKRASVLFQSAKKVYNI